MVFNIIISTWRLYENSQQRVDENISIEVDAVHGEAVVAEIDGRPVDVVGLQGHHSKCSIVLLTLRFSFLPIILGAKFST